MILKETIRRVLREESKKYLKPSENVNQLIIKQLNNLFSGSQMYHEDIANTRQDFLFCKDGKEIAEVWLYFEDEDDDLYESIDKRPTSERPFVEDDGSFISIIDGHHRAQKAVRKGLETIKAKIIPINSLPKDIRRVFKHIN